MPISSSTQPWMGHGWLLALCLLALIGAPALANESPIRLISLAPHLTELAYASGAGEHLVGVVAYSDYPEQARQLPIIGDAFRFDVEKIVSLQANTALAWSGGTPQSVAEQLQRLGIEVIWIETRTLNQIPQALLTIGQLVEDSSAAERTAEQFTQALKQLSEQTDEGNALRTTRIFYQISERPLYTFGGRHVINEVFEVCGARNVFADIDTEALQVDREAMMARSPGLIVIGAETQTHSLENNASSLVSLHRAGLSNTAIHVVDPNLLVRPTPRIIEGIERLCQLVQNFKDHND